LGFWGSVAKDAVPAIPFETEALELESGWAWLTAVAPPSIPATAAAIHMDFIELVMVIS